MWKDVSLRLILKDKCGKQHRLLFCWFFFWKRGSVRKRVRWNRGFRHLCRLRIGVLENSMQSRTVFLLFFGNIPNSKSSWLLNSCDLLSYGSNLRKRYILRLLSMCVGWSNPPAPPINGKAPSPLIPLDGFLLA